MILFCSYSKSFDGNGGGGGGGGGSGGGGQKEVVFGGMGSHTKDAAVLDKSRLRMKVQVPVQYFRESNNPHLWNI